MRCSAAALSASEDVTRIFALIAAVDDGEAQEASAEVNITATRKREKVFFIVQTPFVCKSGIKIQKIMIRTKEGNNIGNFEPILKTFSDNNVPIAGIPRRK